MNEIFLSTAMVIASTMSWNAQTVTNFSLRFNDKNWTMKKQVVLHADGRITYKGLKNHGEALRFVVESMASRSGDGKNLRDPDIRRDRTRGRD